MTQTRESLLPFSPLTHNELQVRRQWHTEECGYIVRGARKRGRALLLHDLERLEREADLAEEYSRASLSRSSNLLST